MAGIVIEVVVAIVFAGRDDWSAHKIESDQKEYEFLHESVSCMVVRVQFECNAMVVSNSENQSKLIVIYPQIETLSPDVLSDSIRLFANKPEAKLSSTRTFILKFSTPEPYAFREQQGKTTKVINIMQSRIMGMFLYCFPPNVPIFNGRGTVVVNGREVLSFFIPDGESTDSRQWLKDFVIEPSSDSDFLKSDHSN